MIDRRIDSLACRKTDKALIVRAKDNGDKKASTFKLNVNLCEPVLVQRCVNVAISWSSFSNLSIRRKIDKIFSKGSIGFRVLVVRSRLGIK